MDTSSTKCKVLRAIYAIQNTFCLQLMLLGNPSSFNNELLQSTGLLYASTRLVPGNMPKIIEWFSLISPQAQAVLLESVVLLDKDAFQSIEKDFRRVIDSACYSSDEWVKSVAKSLRSYPTLRANEDPIKGRGECESTLHLLEQKADLSHKGNVFFALNDVDRPRRPSAKIACE